jgi:thiamine-phosphate pyrophosphorylase
MTLPSPLYAIVDPLDTGRDPIELARAMLAGGARLLQLRLKDVTTAELVAVASRLRDMTAAVGATFIVNDRADVARVVGADGVHVGRDDLPVAAARAFLGPGLLIGHSTHSEAQAEEATGGGADYLSVGPIFATTSKRNPDAVVGCARLAALRPHIAEPVVAIGGIDATNAAQVLAAGADAVAVISALVRAPDVERATAELLEVTSRARPQPAGP